MKVFKVRSVLADRCLMNNNTNPFEVPPEVIDLRDEKLEPGSKLSKLIDMLGVCPGCGREGSHNELVIHFRFECVGGDLI